MTNEDHMIAARIETDELRDQLKERIEIERRQRERAARKVVKPRDEAVADFEAFQVDATESLQSLSDELEATEAAIEQHELTKLQRRAEKLRLALRYEEARIAAQSQRLTRQLSATVPQSVIDFDKQLEAIQDAFCGGKIISQKDGDRVNAARQKLRVLIERPDAEAQAKALRDSLPMQKLMSQCDVVSGNHREN